MKYKEYEVEDILKQFTDSPDKVILQWNINKSNTPLDTSKRTYDHLVYSFPMIVNGEEVASITLVSCYSGDLSSKRDDLMQKYLGHEAFKSSWETFSHDTYLNAYLHVKKTFHLDKIVDGFHAQAFITKDVNGKDLEFKVSYGYPTNEKDSYVKDQWVNSRDYRFGNGVNLSVNLTKGWSLGQKINENIKIRLRDSKIDDITEIITEIIT